MKKKRGSSTINGIHTKSVKKKETIFFYTYIHDGRNGGRQQNLWYGGYIY